MSPYRILEKGRLARKNGGPIEYDTRANYLQACREVTAAVDAEGLLAIVGTDLEAFHIIKESFEASVRVKARLPKAAKGIAKALGVPVEDVLEPSLLPTNLDLGEPVVVEVDLGGEAPAPVEVVEEAPAVYVDTSILDDESVVGGLGNPEAPTKPRKSRNRRKTPNAIYVDDRGRLVHDFYDEEAIRVCPKCGGIGTHVEMYGARTFLSGHTDDGEPRFVKVNQSDCKTCRRAASAASRVKKAKALAAAKAKEAANG